MYVKTFPNIVGNHGPQESKQRVFPVYDNFPASVVYCSRYCAGYLLEFHHERVVLVARQQVGIHKSGTYVGKAYIVMLHAGELGKALEPLHIMYFEEPTSPENPSNFRHIKQKCDLPLATGERSYTRWGFRQFFEDRTLSVIQPDLCNTGGITETKKICDMAQVYDMGVQIHVCGGPIATAAALQVEAAIPNFTIHEEHNANLKNIFIQAGKYYYKPENGYYTVPDLPGIGQEMTDEFLATCRKVVIGG